MLVYVFNSRDRGKMSANGFKEVVSDKRNGIFSFYVDDLDLIDSCADLNDVEYTVSNIMRF